MTSKERMIVAMLNGKADMVPVAPDISNMVPCKLTGRPFWDIYLYKEPPLWKAYIDAVRYFGFDGWLVDDFYVNTAFDEPAPDTDLKETVIVHRDEEKIVTREFTKKGSAREWSDYVIVYYASNPPTGVRADLIGMESVPSEYYPIERSQETKTGVALLREVLDYMGDSGVVATYVGPPSLGKPDTGSYSIYDYMDRYDEVKAWAEVVHTKALEKLERILSSEVKPDFILTGGSGLLIYNTPQILEDLTLPTLTEISRICKKAGMPTQIHCCGPEKELIRMCAEETDINNMNPLEIKPMGDCDLAEMKRLYGGKLSFMGNIHTTDVMLNGTPEDVAAASRQAIDDAADGGGFILSTGDQCGRDTPEENIRTMIEVARTYGKY